MNSRPGGRTRWTVRSERVVDDTRRLRISIASVELPDGECFEQYVLRLPTAAITAVVQDDSVLMIYRHRFVVDRWVWELPGGYVDSGEEPAAAAAREVEEETGWRCRLGTHVGKNEYRDRHGRSKRVDWWLMEPVEGEFAPNDEVDEIRWVPVAEAADVLTHRDDAQLIEAAGLS